MRLFKFLVLILIIFSLSACERKIVENYDFDFTLEQGRIIEEYFGVAERIKVLMAAMAQKVDDESLLFDSDDHTGPTVFIDELEGALDLFDDYYPSDFFLYHPDDLDGLLS